MNETITETWAILAVVLFFLELTSGDFVLCCFGLAAAATVLVSLVTATLKIQLLAFAIFSILALCFVRTPLKRMLVRNSPNRQSNVNALEGLECVVVEQVSREKDGTVKVYGETWKARTEDSEPLLEGTRAWIIKIDGLTLWISSSESKTVNKQ